MRFFLHIPLLFFGLGQAVMAQQVGVGTLVPHPTALLDLNSENKGMLIPRMTSAQRELIPNPTNGLLVFDVTTVGFWYFDGVQWVQPFGPTGAQGPIGMIGPTGPQGPQGPTGQPSNIVGAQGMVGIAGAQGPQGAAGPIGPQGGMGVVGVTGIIGSQGPVGPTGIIGIPGIPGPTGPTGNTGPQGPVGIAGGVGPQGPVGIVGATGPMGPPSFNTAIAISANGIMSITDPQSTLNASAAAWMTLGNAGTNPTNNFLGTTDNQALNISTAATERMRVHANGDIWVDGEKPFFLRRYFCNSCDNPNRNTGISTNDYTAFIAGFYPTGNDGDAESTRARMYNNGGTWWFKGDLEGPDNENWSVDIIFVKVEMTDDQRPASANGGGTAF